MSKTKKTKKPKPPSSFFSFLKKNPLDLIIFLLLFLFCLFYLPADRFWSSFITNREKIYPSETLAQYQPSPQPLLKNKLSPAIFARSYIILDQETNTILASKDEHLRLAPASTTKLVSALTALNIYPLNEQVTVKEAYPIGKNMELQAGETLTVSDLVSGLLIHSANDAAYTLARHNTASVSGFIKQMNHLAQSYDLFDTNFTNFDGIDQTDHYSSAYDLSQIARLSLKSAVIRKAASTKEAYVTDTTNTYYHHLETTNELLGAIPEVKGLKTGWTDLAGECFIGLIEVDGHELITVVLGSQDRFFETQKMIDWIKRNVVWE
jgi:serine-type D-Ala-D-Ala carboxypeptidase (penicillin-binding protein 5/6)